MPLETQWNSVPLLLPKPFKKCDNSGGQGIAQQGFDILVARKRSVSFAKRPGAFLGTIGAKGQVDGILQRLNGSDRYGLVNGWTAVVSASCCTVAHVLGAKSGILRFLCPLASKLCWRHTRQVKKCESCRVRIHITGTLRGQVWQVWIHRPHCKLPVKACRSGQIIATSQASPQKVAEKGKFHYSIISGKSRLVKYYNLARCR